MTVQHMPHLGYQLYLADPRSDSEILNHVCHQNTVFVGCWNDLFQLKKFLSLVFSPDGTAFTALEDRSSRLQDINESPTILTDKVSIP